MGFKFFTILILSVLLLKGIYSTNGKISLKDHKEKASAYNFENLGNSGLTLITHVTDQILKDQRFPASSINSFTNDVLTQKTSDDFRIWPIFILSENQRQTRIRVLAYLKN